MRIYAQTQSAEFCGLVWSIALKCARLFGPLLKSGDAVMRTCEWLSFSVWTTANAIETRCKVTSLLLVLRLAKGVVPLRLWRIITAVMWLSNSEVALLSAGLATWCDTCAWEWNAKEVAPHSGKVKTRRVVHWRLSGLVCSFSFYPVKVALITVW